MDDTKKEQSATAKSADHTNVEATAEVNVHIVDRIRGLIGRARCLCQCQANSIKSKSPEPKGPN